MVVIHAGFVRGATGGRDAQSAQARALLQELALAAGGANIAGTGFTGGGGGPLRLAAAPCWGVSITHTRDFVAAACGATSGVGIDAEWLARRPVSPGVLRRAYHATEIARLEALGEPERHSLALELWTRKEACIKAGCGTSLLRFAARAFVPTAAPGGANWAVYRLPAGPSHAASLAVRDGCERILWTEYATEGGALCPRAAQILEDSPQGWLCG